MSESGLIIRDNGDTVHFKLSVVGDILISNAGDLQQHIDKAIARGQNDITLDLSDVNYMDSFGIGVVIQTQSNLDAKPGSRFRVILNERLHTLFQKSNLEGYIDIIPANEVES